MLCKSLMDPCLQYVTENFIYLGSIQHARIVLNYYMLQQRILHLSIMRYRTMHIIILFAGTDLISAPPCPEPQTTSKS